MNITKVSEIVEQVLIDHPETRESDEMLILKVWAFQNPEIRSKSFSFIDFSHGFLRKKFHSTESIRRSRQKIQEIRADLRGLNYKNRKTHQAEIKRQLKQGKNDKKKNS